MRWFVLASGLFGLSVGLYGPYPMDEMGLILDGLCLLLGSALVAYAVYGKWEDA